MSDPSQPRCVDLTMHTAICIFYHGLNAISNSCSLFQQSHKDPYLWPYKHLYLLPRAERDIKFMLPVSATTQGPESLAIQAICIFCHGLNAMSNSCSLFQQSHKDPNLWPCKHLYLCHGLNAISNPCSLVSVMHTRTSIFGQMHMQIAYNLCFSNLLGPQIWVMIVLVIFIAS